MSTDVIELSKEARTHLLASSAADLENDGAAAKKRRAQATKWFEENGGLASGLEAILGSTKHPDVEPSTVAELLLLTDEATRARCREIGERHWEAAPHEKRIRVLGCFPERSDWAADVARALLAERKTNLCRDLLLSTLADAELLVELAKEEGLSACVVNVVPRLREKAVPVLAAFLDIAKYPNEEKSVARALACIGTPEAAKTFVEHLRKKNVRPYATELFARFPHLAPEALGPLAKKKTQVAEVARTILASLERAASAPDDDAVESASSDAVPAILREPPWTKKKPPARKPIVVPDLPVPREPLRFHWSERARRRYIAQRFDQAGTYRSDDDTQRLKDAIANGKGYLYGNYPPEVSIPLLEQANGSTSIYVFNEAPNHMLALHGARVLDAIVDNHLARLEGPPLLSVESPRVAAVLASSGLNWAKRRRDAFAWIARYPETAPIGLVPVAVGQEPKARRGAELCLRELARLGHREQIMEVAKRLGDSVVVAVEELLAWDRTVELKKPPKMPAIYRAEEHRLPRLENGLALPREATMVLDQLLATIDVDEHPPWLETVRKACDRRSLAEHAWDLAKAWDINGAKEAAIWMLHAVAHLGDDEVVRRLTPALKGEGIAPMLAAIGSDAALMELITIEVRVTSRGQKSIPKYAWGCEEAIAHIATSRGLDIDEVEDRFVPTCNVDADGGVALDLGPRSYRLTFDPQLRPILLDETGTRTKMLPRGAKGDDPEKVAAANVLLTDLTEDVAAIAERRASSLERAMLDGRSWSTEDFRTIWVEHPLMKHMASGVVWQARGGTKEATFRIAEDGSFADEEDDHHPLPEGTTHVGVAHPLRLSAETRAKWCKLFSDYKLLQPFDQLARDEAMAITGETVRKLSVERSEATVRLMRAGFISASRGLHVLPVEGDVDLVVTITNADATARAVRDRRFVDVSTLDLVARAELGRALSLVSG